MQTTQYYESFDKDMQRFYMIMTTLYLKNTMPNTPTLILTQSNRLELLMNDPAEMNDKLRTSYKSWVQEHDPERVESLDSDEKKKLSNWKKSCVNCINNSGLNKRLIDRFTNDYSDKKNELENNLKLMIEDKVNGAEELLTYIKSLPNQATSLTNGSLILHVRNLYFELMDELDYLMSFEEEKPSDQYDGKVVIDQDKIKEFSNIQVEFNGNRIYITAKCGDKDFSNKFWYRINGKNIKIGRDASNKPIPNCLRIVEQKILEKENLPRNQVHFNPQLK